MRFLRLFNLVVFSSLLVILSLSAAVDVFAQDPKISTQAEIKEQVERVPCDPKKRLEEVKKLFLDAGARADDITIVKFKEGENLQIKLKGGGEAEETIVVGAHYDKTDSGCGAVDNWTGIVIIANLYRSLSQLSPKKSYLFVAFDQEEKGMLGSKAMVKSIPKENLSQYCSMVNVDSFGLAAPQVAANFSNSKMMKAAGDLAKEMQIPFGNAAINGADSDSSSFIARKIPALTFHALSDKWGDVLHTSKDKTPAVNVQSVYLGYRLILAYLVRLDAAGCGDFK